jgi:threonine dehydratase
LLDEVMVDEMTTPGRVVPVPTADDLARAWSVVRTHLQPTPVVPTELAGGALLKLECLQPTGSFKVRGALAALTGLAEPDRAAGVVTASAGNHALGVAFAAGRLGVPATVVVPATASPAKVEALRRFPVRVQQHGEGYAAAERFALDLAARGATFVSAYNDAQVIAGQGSLAAELREQVDGPLTIVAPVGGGGLVAGLSLWAAGHPHIRVVGVEAQASRAVSAAVAAGRIVEVTVAPTLADGLAGNLEPGSITPAVIAAHTVDLTVVSEQEIRQAIRFLAARHGIVAEGAGAVAVAAALAGKVEPNGRMVAVITGRNIALPVLAEVLAESHEA